MVLSDMKYGMAINYDHGNLGNNSEATLSMPSNSAVQEKRVLDELKKVCMNCTLSQNINILLILDKDTTKHVSFSHVQCCKYLHKRQN